MGTPMISDDVVIITKRELEDIRMSSFRNGVERGRVEQRYDFANSARGRVNQRTCEHCDVQPAMPGDLLCSECWLDEFEASVRDGDDEGMVAMRDVQVEVR